MNASVQGGRGAMSYEVLSPWANVDPVPLRGLTPRPTALSGKKVGLFSNRKRAAELTLTAVESRLKAQLPSVQTSWYMSTKPNTPEALTEGKARFEEWVRSVDTVVLSVAD